MTIRLYHADAACREFTARVVKHLTQNGRPALIADQTAFYPTAGGQPHDTGLLRAENGAEAAVLEVIDAGSDGIVHVLDRDFPAATFTGSLNWPRRFDHMQQHSGQHVLSQAFVRVAQLDTIAVHIGANDCTLDLPTALLQPARLDAVEDEANRVIYENLAFKTYQVTDAQLPSVPLRKAPKVTGVIRIVEIDGYDWSACGGTHVSACGQIGVIKITKTEKRGNETRVTFRCGARALQDYRSVLRDTTALAERFTVSRADLGAAVEKLRDEALRTSKALAIAQSSLLEAEAVRLLATALPEADGRRVIVLCKADQDIKQLQALARLLTAQPDIVAALGGYGERSALCIARSANLADIDAAALLRAALTTLPNGKGGGTPALAQGSTGYSDADTLRTCLAQAVLQART